MPRLRRFKNSPYFYACGLDSNGKEWCASTKQTARDAALKVARKLELERAVPGLQPLALSEALTTLAQHKRRKRVSSAELGIVATKCARLLEHFGPGRNCQTLTTRDIDGYIDARRLDVADSTIGKELGMLFQALLECKRDGGRYGGDVSLLYPTVLHPAEPGDRWLDDHEYLALLLQVPPQRRDYVVVHCHVGPRYGELYRIEAKHLDHDGQRVWLLGTKGDAQWRERWVPLSSEAYEVLAARAELHPTGPLFPQRWLKPNMRLTLARACRRAGIDPVTANDLRRTFCSWCARHGVTERECQRFMGHSPASLLVRRVYAQLAPEAGREAVARFPGVSGAVSASTGVLGGPKRLGRTSSLRKTS